MTSVKQVIINAAFLNRADITLTCCSHLVHDSVTQGSLSPSDPSQRTLSYYLNQPLYHTLLSRLIESFIYGLQFDNLDYHLQQLFHEGYVNTYSYFLNLTSIPEASRCLISPVHAQESPFLSWVFSKFQTNPSSHLANQPILCNHHQYLSFYSYDIFCEISSHFRKSIHRYFSPQVTVSNGHIDHLVPSIYEHILFKDTILPPSVFTSREHAANSSIIGFLSDIKAISLQPFDRLYTVNDLVKFSLCSDFTSLTLSLVRLGQTGIPTIYSRNNNTLSLHHLPPIPSSIRALAIDAGYPVSSSYTAVHNRDACYKQQSALSGRDSDINLLVQAISPFRSKDKPFIRIGASGLQPSCGSIFTYDSTSDDYCIEDHILLLNCFSLLGTSSGPGHYAASLFGVPTLFLNSTTLLPCHLLLSNMIIALKNIISVPGNSLDEKLAALLRVWFDRSSVQFSDLTVAELTADLQDFHSFLNHGKRLMPLSSLVPFSTFCHSSILSNVFLTDRCFSNLHKVLLEDDT